MSAACACAAAAAAAGQGQGRGRRRGRSRADGAPRVQGARPSGHARARVRRMRGWPGGALSPPRPPPSGAGAHHPGAPYRAGALPGGSGHAAPACRAVPPAPYPYAPAAAAAAAACCSGGRRSAAAAAAAAAATLPPDGAPPPGRVAVTADMQRPPSSSSSAGSSSAASKSRSGGGGLRSPTDRGGGGGPAAGSVGRRAGRRGGRARRGVWAWAQTRGGTKRATRAGGEARLEEPLGRAGGGHPAAGGRHQGRPQGASAAAAAAAAAAARTAGGMNHWRRRPPQRRQAHKGHRRRRRGGQRGRGRVWGQRRQRPVRVGRGRPRRRGRHGEGPAATAGRTAGAEGRPQPAAARRWQPRRDGGGGGRPGDGGGGVPPIDPPRRCGPPHVVGGDAARVDGIGGGGDAAVVPPPRRVPPAMGRRRSRVGRRQRPPLERPRRRRAAGGAAAAPPGRRRAVGRPPARRCGGGGRHDAPTAAAGVAQVRRVPAEAAHGHDAPPHGDIPHAAASTPRGRVGTPPAPDAAAAVEEPPREGVHPLRPPRVAELVRRQAALPHKPPRAVGAPKRPAARVQPQVRFEVEALGEGLGAPVIGARVGRFARRGVSDGGGGGERVSRVEVHDGRGGARLGLGAGGGGRRRDGRLAAAAAAAAADAAAADADTAAGPGAPADVIGTPPAERVPPPTPSASFRPVNKRQPQSKRTAQPTSPRDTRGRGRQRGKRAPTKKKKKGGNKMGSGARLYRAPHPRADRGRAKDRPSESRVNLPPPATLAVEVAADATRSAAAVGGGGSAQLPRPAPRTAAVRCTTPVAIDTTPVAIGTTPVASGTTPVTIRTTLRTPPLRAPSRHGKGVSGVRRTHTPATLTRKRAAGGTHAHPSGAGKPPRPDTAPRQERSATTDAEGPPHTTPRSVPAAPRRDVTGAPEWRGLPQDTYAAGRGAPRAGRTKKKRKDDEKIGSLMGAALTREILCISQSVSEGRQRRSGGQRGNPPLGLLRTRACRLAGQPRVAAQPHDTGERADRGRAPYSLSGNWPSETPPSPLLCRGAAVNSVASSRCFDQIVDSGHAAVGCEASAATVSRQPICAAPEVSSKRRGQWRRCRRHGRRPSDWHQTHFAIGRAATISSRRRRSAIVCVCKEVARETQNRAAFATRRKRHGANADAWPQAALGVPRATRRVPAAAIGENSCAHSHPLATRKAWLVLNWPVEAVRIGGGSIPDVRDKQRWRDEAWYALSAAESNGQSSEVASVDGGPSTVIGSGRVLCRPRRRRPCGVVAPMAKRGKPRTPWTLRPHASSQRRPRT
ncbi:hypothetical protein BU14_0184s0004 [Porphyra umbilicalis]|uniref:Uncharacterized protein n=1 Tax=Porphyra umbilicalis TaxID=2786 RepID=A0A1X6P6X0_PORUM|nr:hypothetical protein BU14_0184s0004 [Porphyra umbilicalis]|eukprot:OSX76577.1 hypothetical protein BU14_0184s0004 [Porphyra umbilicalis]